MPLHRALLTARNKDSSGGGVEGIAVAVDDLPFTLFATEDRGNPQRERLRGRAERRFADGGDLLRGTGPSSHGTWRHAAYGRIMTTVSPTATRYAASFSILEEALPVYDMVLTSRRIRR